MCQIVSGTKLRLATEADLKVQTQEELQHHLLLKMGNSFFLARWVLSEDGGQRELRAIPVTGAEAFVVFNIYLVYEPKHEEFLATTDIDPLLSVRGMTRIILTGWGTIIWPGDCRCGRKIRSTRGHVGIDCLLRFNR